MFVLIVVLSSTLLYSSIKAEIKNEDNINIDCGSSVMGKASCSDDLHILNYENNSQRIAENYELPWVAYINVSFETVSFFCAGVLINESMVLSAAACFADDKTTIQPKQVMVTLGLNDNLCPTKEVQKIRVENIIIHPKFIYSTYENNIALVQLKHRANYSIAVRPICLPPKDNETYAGRMGFVSGWDKYKLFDGVKGYSLTQTLGKIVANDNQDFVNGHEQVISDGEMNVYVRNNSCLRNLGAPISLPVLGKCSVVGIYSGGEPCSVNDYAGVFTRITHYLDWIMHG